MSKEMSFRMDFVQEIIDVNPDTGTIKIRLIPDPERYEWKIMGEGKVLFDKLDNICFPEDEFIRGMEKFDEIPITYQPQLIEDSRVYIKERIPFIKNELDGNYDVPTFEDKSEVFLESLEKNELGFVILSLDIVGSTKLSTEKSLEFYTRMIKSVLFEISNVVPSFHGHVLKYTGDGIIAYFPEPSFIIKNDLALDCSLTLRRLIYEGINPILIEKGFGNINIRIGLDSGNAFVTTIGSPKTKQHKDIIGKVVSLAAKIQSNAEIGGISLGEITVQHLHTKYRKVCVLAELPEKWSYKKEDDSIYNIFKIDFEKYDK